MGFIIRKKIILIDLKNLTFKNYKLYINNLNI